MAVRTQSLWDASPGVMSQPPWSLGRFSGRRPCARSAIARDRLPLTQSPEGGSQRAVQLGVPTPRHLGVEKRGVDEAVGPRAFFELSELSAESLRQVARTRKSTENHAARRQHQQGHACTICLETSPAELHLFFFSKK